MNKYAEGYPGHRYYGGCEYVDIAEQICIERAKQIFSAKYANVQAHSGSQANFCVYLALCKPGDTVHYDDESVTTKRGNAFPSRNLRRTT